MHKKRAVIASVGRRQIVFPSITDVMIEYKLSSSQIVRLIEKGQNIPHTGVTLDWYLGDENEELLTVMDVTCDMMSEAHIVDMEKKRVRVLR